MKNCILTVALLCLPGVLPGVAAHAASGSNPYDKNFDVPAMVHTGKATVAQVPECTQQTTPDYPREALRSRAQGKVRARLEIGPDGLVKNVAIEQSSLAPAERQAFEETIRKAATTYQCDRRGQPYQVIQEFVFSVQ
jgi:TonB family protein